MQISGAPLPAELDEKANASRLQVLALAPAQEASDWLAFIDGRRTGLAQPFADHRIRTLAGLSSRILQHPYLRSDTPSVALAYWLRAANLKRLQESAEGIHLRRSNCIPVPAGMVFHITPANVDTMFIYSWALAYLCGNSSLLRLSQAQTPVIQGLLACLNAEMEANPDLALANRFVTYEHNDDVTAAISARCALRVVWGGNETVNRIRRIPLNPHAAERAFPTKYSYSIVNTDAYLSSSPQQQATLAERFFGDVFAFDQMGCSSPHAVLWSGDGPAAQSATELFDRALSHELARRGKDLSIALAVRRRNYAFELAAAGEASFHPEHSGFTSLRGVGDKLLRPHCGGGLYAHLVLTDWEQLSSFAEEQDQTVGHFGFDGEELQRLANLLAMQGVDRVVPIGQALAFESNWDGFDLIGDFLRYVTVRE